MSFMIANSFRLSSRATCGAKRAFATNIFDVNDEKLTEFVVATGSQEYRVNQIKSWIYQRGVLDFDAMIDIPVALRRALGEQFKIGSLSVALEQVSKDGTRKRAYQLQDGKYIESVLMPYNDGRHTACISSQVGCAMGCVFCATGQMGFTRQLTSTEIFEQAQQFSSELVKEGKRLSNVVFMGMGEPLANYNNVMAAVRRLNSDLGIGARQITISTVGMVPRILKLAEEPLQVGLAVSLHQTTDERRSALMPINKKYPIAELIAACKTYIAKTNRRVTFEWALIRGQTDSEQTAHELGNLLRHMLCHVNVIPLNPTEGFDGKPTEKTNVDVFVEILCGYGISATPRVRRGIDIDAGCGQLTTRLLQTNSQELLGGCPSHNSE